MRDAIILGDAERPQAPQTDSGSLGGWGRGCPHVTGAFLHGVSHDAEGTRCSSDSRCGITFKDGATWRPVRARGCHSGVVVSGAGAEGEEPRVSSHLRLLIRCSPLGSLASFLTVASWSVTREPLGAAGSPRFAEHFPHGGSLPGGLSETPLPVSATHPWRPWRSPRSGTKALGEAEPRERTQVTDGSSLTLSCSLPPQRCSGGSCLPTLLPSGQLPSFLGFCWVAQIPALPLFLPKAVAAAPPCPPPQVFLPPVGPGCVAHCGRKGSAGTIWRSSLSPGAWPRAGSSPNICLLVGGGGESRSGIFSSNPHLWRPQTLRCRPGSWC